MLDRNFTTARENQAWVSDIAYMATGEGWLYLTTVIDLFDRKVIGWAFSGTMKAGQTTVAAFKMAAKNRAVGSFLPLIFHSDRGVQYACGEFTALLDCHKNITRSMSRKGNCCPKDSFGGTIPWPKASLKR